MGYSTESITSSPYRLPQIGNLLPETSIRDLLIVAVEVDYPRGRQFLDEQSYRIGLSILDTRCITGQIDASKPIASYQFIINDSRSCRTAKKRFLFGESETISLSGFAARLEMLVHGRDYVLAGHGMDTDLKLLNEIDPKIATNAAYVLDTVKVAQFPLQLHYRYSLEKLLAELDIKYAKLHTAGNDAHFALRALLMLIVCDGMMGESQKSLDELELFMRLDRIAHMPVDLLVWTEEPPPKPEKKAKMGILAKRRLKQERKARRRAFQQLPFYDEVIGESSDDSEWEQVEA